MLGPSVEMVMTRQMNRHVHFSKQLRCKFPANILASFTISITDSVS